MTDDLTRIRLPHTGLRVPDSSLSLTGYRARTTADGVWFRANLNIFGTLVGQVRNAGNGAATYLTGDPDHPIYGDAEIVLADYAGRCLTEEGDRLGLEHLIDELIAEHEWVLKLADAATKRGMLLRLMTFIIDGFPPRPTREITSEPPTAPKHWNKIRKALRDDPQFTPGKDAWWQAWHQNRWQDATRRPAKANPDLYG